LVYLTCILVLDRKRLTADIRWLWGIIKHS